MIKTKKLELIKSNRCAPKCNFDESVIFNIALEFDESKINIDKLIKFLKN